MNGLTGTRNLARLALRRDRVVLPIWMLLMAVLPASTVASFKELYPTAAERLKYKTTTGDSPTFLALYGPAYDHTLGALTAQRAGFVPVVIALISILLVVRHTRTEEEAGRRELLGATVMGRGAGLAAALLVAMAANAVVAVLVAAMMAGQDLPAGGSLALGLQFALAGCVFAAVAGVAAQLTESAGSARGIAIALLGGAFAVRMAGDVGGSDSPLAWLSWASPLGWASELRPYGGEQWWVMGLLVALTALLTAVAAALSGRRDLGAGLLPAKPGPANAAPSLSGPFGLAWRLHSRPLLGWLAGFAALGLIYGAIADTMNEMVRDNPDLKEIFERLGGGGTLVDTYFASTMGMLALIATGYAISATLRMRTEETSLHVESVLATAVGRMRWTASHLAFTLLGSTLLLVTSGFISGLVYGIVIGDVGGQLPPVVGAALVQLPAVWVMASIAVALFGLVPRATQLAWGALAVAAVITMFGSGFQADQWLLNLSPFGHIPRMPGHDLLIMPLVWLLALAAALGAAGLAAFHRRSLELS